MIINENNQGSATHVHKPQDLLMAPQKIYIGYIKHNRNLPVKK